MAGPRDGLFKESHNLLKGNQGCLPLQRGISSLVKGQQRPCRGVGEGSSFCLLGTTINNKGTSSQEISYRRPALAEGIKEGLRKEVQMLEIVTHRNMRIVQILLN